MTEIIFCAVTTVAVSALLMIVLSLIKKKCKEYISKGR